MDRLTICFASDEIQGMRSAISESGRTPGSLRHRYSYGNFFPARELEPLYPRGKAHRAGVCVFAYMCMPTSVPAVVSFPFIFLTARIPPAEHFHF